MHAYRIYLFGHVQIKIISTGEPLLGCGPLPDWLRKKRCIYALDGTEDRIDNLCMWRCLAVHYRGDRKQREKFTTREALNLAVKLIVKFNQRSYLWGQGVTNFDELEKFSNQINLQFNTFQSVFCLS